MSTTTKHEAIEAIAADWLAKQDAGALSGQDQARLDAWLTASTAHRVSYLRLQSAWQRADRLKAAEHVLDMPASDANSQNRFAAERVTTGSPLRLRPHRIAASVALLAVSVALLSWHWSWSRYESRRGQISSIPLSDGSLVTLNTDSRMRVDIGERERSIDLSRGEAFFEVAKDTARPFRVHADDYDVVAVGTQFAVRYVGNDIRVSVLEGKVRVESGNAASQPVVLVAGQISNAENGTLEISSPGIDTVGEELSWRRGWLVFHDRRLDYVVEEFQRYSDAEITISDPALAALHITGTFRTNNLQGFLRLLEQGFGIRIERSGDRVRLVQS